MFKSGNEVTMNMSSKWAVGLWIPTCVSLLFVAITHSHCHGVLAYQGLQISRASCGLKPMAAGDKINFLGFKLSVLGIEGH